MSERLNTDSVSPPIPASPVDDIVVRSGSVTGGYNEQAERTEYRRIASDNHRIIFSGLPSGGTLQPDFPLKGSDGSADSWDGIPRLSSSMALRFSSSASVEMVDDSVARTEKNEAAFDPSRLQYFSFSPHQSSPPRIVSKSCLISLVSLNC